MDAAALYRQYAGEAGFDLDALRSVMQTLGTPRDDADLAQLLTHLDADGKSAEFPYNVTIERQVLLLLLAFVLEKRGRREGAEEAALHASAHSLGQWRHTGRRQPFSTLSFLKLRPKLMRNASAVS